MERDASVSIFFSLMFFITVFSACLLLPLLSLSYSFVLLTW